MLFGLFGFKTITVTTGLGYYEVFEKIRATIPSNETRAFFGNPFPNYSYYQNIYNNRFEIIYGDHKKYKTVFWVLGKVQKKENGSQISLSLIPAPLELIKITILVAVFILMFVASFHDAGTLLAHLGYGIIVFIYIYWYVKNRQQLIQFTIGLLNGKIKS